MWLTAAFFYFLLTKINHATSTNRIIGGRIVQDPREYPFIVSLRLDGRHICGGSIIDYRHVITAAHCCFGSNNKVLPPQIMSIAAGNLNIRTPHNSTVFKKVDEIIFHRGYDPQFIVNDVAILQISGKFPDWTENILPVNLNYKTPEYGNCTVCGWGVTRQNTTLISPLLQCVDVNLISTFSCNRTYYPQQITKGMVCAGGNGSDSCQGDSGGPLVCKGALTGIVSWGSGCGVNPGVYTAVAEYQSWIRKYSNSPPTLVVLSSIYLLLLLHYLI